MRGAWALAVLLALVAAGCGPGAEITSITPSEVMNVSAWVTAHVPGAVAAVVTAVPASAFDGDLVETPTLPVSDDFVTVALLGMRPDTEYQVTVRGFRSGGTAVSEPMSFRTGSLPAGLPLLNVQGAGWSDAKTLVGMFNPGGAVHAPMIVDREGQVIWYHVTDNAVTDFQRQPDGTYTACEVSSGPGGTRFDQFDREGRLLRVWTAPPESAGTDWHELRMLPGDLALLWGSETRVMDLSAKGGSPTATVVGSVLYRVQPDGVVLFRWSAFDHFTFDDIDPAVDVTQPTVDWSHADSVDVGTDGTYLLTFRNLSQVVKVSAGSGAVIWRLGGKRSDWTFPDDPLGGPSFPHGARVVENGNILLFDDGAGRATQASRAVQYSLDQQTMQAHRLWEYAPSSHFSPDMGFAQRTGNGTTLVTFSTEGVAEEIEVGSNAVMWSLHSATQGVPIYRALRVGTLY
ncbi:MAG TPA: aryl-sulfate sulfotransferase [Myxococcaceae bacterium]|nr:aryl-sulfate sulfotransferase [Myxococcaceae bacterium]